MYFPSLFAPARSFEPGLLGTGPGDPPVLGSVSRENPLDLSTKPIRPAAEAGSETEATELLMLDHRKLANLAASHPLSAMGRQLATGAAPANVMDPTLYRLAYGPEALALPAPFCYDRATGVAVPTSLASHQLMTSFLQQRERCIEQQQQAALLAARNSAQQAAVAAAFMDPTTLTYGLRTAMTQREAAAALAATRGLYAPTMPTPMVLPAFSLYTDDKGAFTSLRNGSAAEKAYLNGAAAQSGVIEAARYAEHLQRLREQHAGKCANACCAGLPGIPSTVPCACCMQTPGGPTMCARSPLGALKPTEPVVTTSKPCDFLQSGLPYLHRPTAATAATSTDLRLPMPNYCSANFTSSTTDATVSTPVFQPATTWSTGLPSVSSSGKTAFTVPKKKEVPKTLTPQKDPMKMMNGGYYDKECHQPQNNAHDKRELEKPVFKKELFKCREEKDVFVINDAPVVATHHRREHDVKSMLTPKTSTVLSIPKPVIQLQAGIAQTTVTAVTPIVSTKREGGTIPKTKLPPVLEAYRPVDVMSHNGNSYADVPTSLPSAQGPPPLIAVTGKSHQVGNKEGYPFSYADSSAARHQAVYHGSVASSASSPAKCSVGQVCTDLSKKSPKKPVVYSKDTGLPSYVKDEPSPSKPPTSMVIPKPVPQIPSGNYTSHFRPYALQNHPSWVPPANPNVTVSPSVAPQLPKTTAIASTTTTTTSSSSASVIISPNHKVVKSEPLPVVTNVKKEPEYDHNANVLQSLLIRHGQSSGLMMPHRGPYSILDYHQYHQQLAQHGLNVPHAYAPSVVDCTAPSASTVPISDKPEPKLECGNGVECIRAKQAKKRCLETTPTKVEDNAEEKRKIPKLEYSVPPHPYTYQYPPFSVAETKPTPVCPYTFVPEPPGYYEKQMTLPKQIRPCKTSIVKCEQYAPHIQCEAKVADYRPNEEVVSDFTSPLHFHLKSLNRAAQARARSKLLRKVLYRYFYNARKAAFAQEVQPARETTAQTPEGTVSGPRKYVYRISKRRRIRSGLDMAFKRTKKRTGTMYKKMEKVNQHHSSSLTMPAEMKKIMVNKALGETVLHRASRLGYPEVVVYCLETNCGNVNARDNAGYTPLHECCSRGHIHIAKALLQYGADVNASAAGGIRPLHDAVENDHVEVVRLLLSFGADPSIATYSGLTPHKLARSPLMAEFLQGFMADISGEIDIRPHLPWRFWGSSSCLDPLESGYDMFEGVPPDDETESDDFLFEVSDSPHLPTFRLSLDPLYSSSPATTQCNYLRLSDVLRKTSMTRAYFLEHCQHIEVLSLSKPQFEASATCSQLLTGSKLDATPRDDRASNQGDALDDGHTVELVRLDHNIRKVLGIETVSLR